MRRLGSCSQKTLLPPFSCPGSGGPCARDSRLVPQERQRVLSVGGPAGCSHDTRVTDLDFL